MSEQDETLAYLDRVATILREKVGGNLPEIPTHDAAAMRMYSRVRSLLEASRALVERDLGLEAMMLGRAVFTESLWLMTLDRAGPDRAAYALGWSSKALTNEENLVREAERLGLLSSEDAQRHLNYLQGRRRDLTNYQHRHQVGKLRPFGDEEQMARLVGREGEDLLLFRVAHEIVHGSEFMHQWRTTRDPNTGEYRFAMTTRDDALNADVATFVGRSALMAHRAMCHIMGWLEAPDLDDLLNRSSPSGDR